MDVPNCLKAVANTRSNNAADFQLATTTVFMVAREGVSKAAILITGSVLTTNDLNTEVTQLKGSCVNLVVVGVGSFSSGIAF